MTTEFSIITPVNDFDVYAQCVMKSNLPSNDVIRIYNESSAAVALNKGIEQAKNDLLVCCHQDVRFPQGWEKCLEELPEDFGLCGLFGCDMNKRYAGHITDPHGHRKWGDLPCEAMSLDELCLILRKSSGLRFDEKLYGWHLYGADICLQAISKGMKCWIIDAHAEHLSGGKIDKAFIENGQKFYEKWTGKSPIQDFKTTCTNMKL